MGDYVSPSTETGGSFNSSGDFEESSHHCMQPADELSRTSWQAGVCTDHQEPTTCVTNLGVDMARFTQFPLMITRWAIIYEIISPGAAGSSIYV